MEIRDTTRPVVVLDPLGANLNVIRTLGRAGVPVYGVYSDPRTPAARSRYCAGAFRWPPGMSERQSVGVLLAIADRVGGTPILIPADDMSALLVADHADALAEVFLFPAQPPALARKLSSKKQMYHFCKQVGVPTAETAFPQSRADVERFVATAAFPVVLKGIDGLRLRQRGGASVLITRTPKELLACYDRHEEPGEPNLMLQEYIPGGPDTIWMFDGYFDRDSRCLIGVVGQKIRQYPAYTGMTSLGVCVRNPLVEQMTEALMKRIAYRGIVDLGYRYDARDGQYKLLDVNPRVGASFRLFVDSNGGDVVRAMYLDLTGQPVPSGKPCEGRKWLVENFDIVSSFTYWRHGELTPWAWWRSFRGVREANWFARDDMAPFWAMCRHSLLRGLQIRPKPRRLVGRTADTGVNPRFKNVFAAR